MSAEESVPEVPAQGFPAPRYSNTVMAHGVHPRNLGAIEGADGHARVTGLCRDTMEMWLTVRHDVITDISFITDGCITSLAAGSMTTELAKGKRIGEVFHINQRDILDALGGLPEGSEHCALLAATTLKATIRDLIALRNEPWKKFYRR